MIDKIFESVDPIGSGVKPTFQKQKISTIRHGGGSVMVWGWFPVAMTSALKSALINRKAEVAGFPVQFVDNNLKKTSVDYH